MFKMLAGFTAPVIDYPFARSDVAMYQRMLATATATAATAQEGGPAGAAASVSPAAAPVLVDDQTWNDMLLDAYSDRLARGTGIFGQQELHRRLRSGMADRESAARVRALERDGAACAALQAACADLRCAEAEIAELLFGAGPDPAPRWVRLINWLPVVFLLTIPVAVFWWPAWLLTVSLWLVLMGVQVGFFEQSQQWERLVATLQLQLRAHSLLGGIGDASAVPAADPAAGLGGAASAAARFAQPFRDGMALAGKLSRKLGRSPLERVVPGMREYGEWIGLNNIRRYFDGRDLFLANRAFLRTSFCMVARLEADLALAREVHGAAVGCWAQEAPAGYDPRHAARSKRPVGQDTLDDVPPARAFLALDGVVHPLLEHAVPLTIALDGKGAFISGQNGIGKSTLLRTVGLNLITARAFGFCYARSAAVPLLPVYSSMQSEDSLAGGESLYIAELRRAHELLALAGRGKAVFLIDEIFRGTNHLESVSGAAAVLDTLARQGTVIVSSHNLVLAPLLAHCLAPLCVGKDGGELRVRPGVLAHTNGLALLGARGFGPAIEAKAARVHDWFSAYLAHPEECGHVLRADAALLAGTKTA